MRRHKDALLAMGEIDLYDALVRIQADDSADASTRKFLRQAIEANLIEIEAHALVDDQLFLLSVLSRKGRLVSYFWRYRCAQKKLSLLAAFPGKRAEGITLVKAGRAAMVVFDAGGKAASAFQLIGVHDATP